MRKLIIAFLFFFIFFLSSREAHASVVTIKANGELVLNVLASETTSLSIPKRSELSVKSTKTEEINNDSKVSLLTYDGKLILNIDSPEGEKELDVTNVSGEIVEIEERPEVDTLKVAFEDGAFSLIQEGIEVKTSFPVSIDPKSAELTLSTPSGERYLAIFPKEALAASYRAKVLSSMKEATLTEEGGEALTYVISGTKSLNIFNLFKLDVDVKTKVSASTGEIILVEEPTWVKVLGFIFV